MPRDVRKMERTPDWRINNFRMFPPELVSSSLSREPTPVNDENTKPSNNYFINVGFIGQDESFLGAVCKIQANRKVGEIDIISFDATYSVSIECKKTTITKKDKAGLAHFVIGFQVWTLFRSLLASHSSQMFSGLPTLPKLYKSNKLEWNDVPHEDLQNLSTIEIEY